MQHGALEIQLASGSEWAAVSNGFADVSAERVVVLADSCVLAAEIDKASVEATLSEAQTELTSLAESDETASRREALSDVIRQSEVQLEVDNDFDAASNILLSAGANGKTEVKILTDLDAGGNIDVEVGTSGFCSIEAVIAGNAIPADDWTAGGTITVCP